MSPAVLAIQELSELEPEKYTLDQYDRILSILHNDIRWVIDESAILRRTNTAPRYCLDYDVIFPTTGSETVKKSRPDSSESAFWSSLVIDLRGVEIILLPGTLFEILFYAEDKLDAVRKLSKTALASAFMDSITELNFEKIAKTDSYDKLLSAFRDATISDQDFYLLSLIQKRAAFLDRPLPPINRDLFFQCIVQLSRGARMDKIRNNTVDAYNYSLVAALNEKCSSHHRYLLVSTSRFMRRLETDAQYTASAALPTPHPDIPHLADSIDSSTGSPRHNVITPRRAALFELLASASGGFGDRFKKHATQLLVEISDAQHRLARAIMDVGSGEAIVREVAGTRSDNIFLQLISSFVAIHEKIKEANKQKRESIEILSRKYDLRNPIDFYENLNKSVKELIRDVGYQDELLKEIPRKAARLKIVERPLDPRLANGRHVEAVGPGEDIAFAYFEYDSDQLFISKGSMTPDGFVALYNVIATEVFAKIAAQKYGNWPQSAPVALIVGDGNNLIEKPLDELVAPITVKNVADRFRLAEKEINFIRINQSWFEMSYEDGISTLSTAFPMIDEIALFLQQTTKVDYRATNFKPIVARLLRASP